MGKNLQRPCLCSWVTQQSDFNISLDKYINSCRQRYCYLKPNNSQMQSYFDWFKWTLFGLYNFFHYKKGQSKDNKHVYNISNRYIITF